MEIPGLDGAGVEIHVPGAGILLKGGRGVWLQESDGKRWGLRGWSGGVGLEWGGVGVGGEGRICGLDGGGPDQDQ